MLSVDSDSTLTRNHKPILLKLRVNRPFNYRYQKHTKNVIYSNLGFVTSYRKWSGKDPHFFYTDPRFDTNFE